MKYKLLTCNVPSPYTNRIYPKPVVEKAVEAYREKIDLGIAFGEFESEVTDVNPLIRLDRVSHLVTEMYFDQDDLFAEIKILNTPMGLILEQLVTFNAPFRISPCFTGTFEDDLQTLKEVTLEKTHILSTNIMHDGAD